MTRGQFHKLFLCPKPFRQTFAPVKRFSKSWAQMDRAISMIRALLPTFMKSTPYFLTHLSGANLIKLYSLGWS